MDAMRLLWVKDDWRDVPEFPGYKVNGCGDVMSYKRRKFRGELLMAGPSLNGYTSYSIRRRGVTFKMQAARLVLRAFDRAPQDKEEARHLDGDSANNCRANLAWGTKAENVQDAVRYGTHNMCRNGEQHPGCKIPFVVVCSIRSEPLSVPAKQVAHKYGVHYQTVYYIRRGVKNNIAYRGDK
jgi:hypothetical protein